MTNVIPLRAESFNPERAQMAWDAHRAILLLQRDHPELDENPMWVSIRDFSAAQYRDALVGLPE